MPEFEPQTPFQYEETTEYSNRPVYIDTRNGDIISVFPPKVNNHGRRPDWDDEWVAPWESDLVVETDADGYRQVTRCWEPADGHEDDVRIERWDLHATIDTVNKSAWEQFLTYMHDQVDLSDAEAVLEFFTEEHTFGVTYFGNSFGNKTTDYDVPALLDSMPDNDTVAALQERIDDYGDRIVEKDNQSDKNWLLGANNPDQKPVPTSRRMVSLVKSVLSE